MHACLCINYLISYDPPQAGNKSNDLFCKLHDKIPNRKQNQKLLVGKFVFNYTGKFTGWGPASEHDPYLPNQYTRRLHPACWENWYHTHAAWEII